MKQQSNILIIGATQGTGELIARALLKQGHTISVFARNRAKAEEKFAGSKVTVLEGDVTQPKALKQHVAALDYIVLTVGVTKRPAAEDLICSTEYDGTRNILDIARQGGFRGRLLYMTSIGTERSSWLGAMLNLVKRNTLIWRRKAEEAIRESGIPYTIIRAGLLNDQPAATHELMISTEDLPLTLGHKISRADVADVFVEVINSNPVGNAAFSVVWKVKGQRQPLATLLQYHLGNQTSSSFESMI